MGDGTNYFVLAFHDRLSTFLKLVYLVYLTFVTTEPSIHPINHPINTPNQHRLLGILDLPSLPPVLLDILISCPCPILSPYILYLLIYTNTPPHTLFGRWLSAASDVDGKVRCTIGCNLWWYQRVILVTHWHINFLLHIFN